MGDSYYTYKTRSKWERDNKRTKTLPPEYIGVITHNDIIMKDQVTGIRSDMNTGILPFSIA